MKARPRIGTACLLVLLAACASPDLCAQRRSRLQVRRIDDDRAVVRGDLVAADQALAGLADAMGWELRIESLDTGLGSRLADEVVDLSVEDDARQIARWIGYAVDAQVVFVDRLRDSGMGTDLVVRPLPQTSTEAGRERCLELAALELQTWLDTFDGEEPQGPGSAAGRAVRVALGPIERQLGQPELGALHLSEVVYAPFAVSERSALRQALLIELGLCWFDAGPDPQYDVDAERALRTAIRVDPASTEAARAAEILARMLYRRRDDEACLDVIGGMILENGWGRSDESVIDMQLTLGHSALRVGDIARAQAALSSASVGLAGRSVSGRRSVELAGLEGALAFQVRDFERVVQTLSRFLRGMEPDDARREGTRLMLAEACLETGRFTFAWSLAKKAFEHRGRLDDRSYLWAVELFDRSAHQIGQANSVLAQLDVDARVDPERRPELLLYVASRLTQVGRLESARLLLQHAVSLPGPKGDRVRAASVAVLLEQSKNEDDPEFPPEARQLALQIEDPVVRREMLGTCAGFFTHFGQHELAASAWQGILP